MFDSILEVLLWSLWFFFLIAFLILLFRIFGDLFGDKETGGFAKVLWTLFLIFLPLLGALVYLIARGKGMGERQMAAMADMQARQEQYIQSVAAKSASPADQIASAKQLLDSGAISQAEFDALKAKALG
ncbi:MAG: SHOCT domain-containing protein [Candidatus Nanopelagicales bacterium]|jgi:hypothetical protein|nr:SHOCT domain-containing protein [Candidatus Nanopelagicales bacterium]